MAYQLEFEIVVQSEHLDELNHVNNVVYLQWAQDIAERHWKSLADEGLQSKYRWVVIRHEIDYKLPCKLKDVLRIKTKVAEDIHGPKWGRYINIYNGQKLAVSVFSLWCLIDAFSGRPLRISDELESLLREN